MGSWPRIVNADVSEQAEPNWQPRHINSTMFLYVLVRTDDQTGLSLGGLAHIEISQTKRRKVHKKAKLIYCGILFLRMDNKRYNYMSSEYAN